MIDCVEASRSPPSHRRKWDCQRAEHSALVVCMLYVLHYLPFHIPNFNGDDGQRKNTGPYWGGGDKGKKEMEVNFADFLLLDATTRK